MSSRQGTQREQTTRRNSHGGSSLRGSARDGASSALARQASQKSEVSRGESSHSSSLRGFIEAKSRAALVVRAVFLFILFASAVSVALLVYYYTTNEQQDEFRAEFHSDADKIFQTIATTFDTTLAAADNFVAAIVAHKYAMNGTFPFVALSNYPLQAAKVKSLSKAYVTSLHYLVSEEQRNDWEKFAAENNRFVQEAWNLQAQDSSWQGSLATFPRFQNQLFAKSYIIPPGDGPYLVSWQNYPIVFDPQMAPYNYDVFSLPSLARHWLPVIESKRPMVTRFENVMDPFSVRSKEEQQRIDRIRNFIPADENPAEPVMTLIYPIIDQKESVKVDPDRVNEAQFVGTLSFSLFWRELLRNSLPDKSKGIYVVTETLCGQSFTYEINGARTFYIANTDVHESRYDYMQVSKSFTSIVMKQEVSGKQRFYSGVPLSDASCPVTIKISPSESYENLYKTGDPMIFAISAGLIFVLAGGIFVLYDYLVDLGKQENQS